MKTTNDTINRVFQGIWRVTLQGNEGQDFTVQTSSQLSPARDDILFFNSSNKIVNMASYEPAVLLINI